MGNNINTQKITNTKDQCKLFTNYFQLKFAILFNNIHILKYTDYTMNLITNYVVSYTFKLLLHMKSYYKINILI